MIANTPVELAQRVILLLEEPELRDRIAWNARNMVKQYYDWQRITKQLLNVYHNLVHQTDGQNILGKV